jgi:uncharacterized membrane protein YhaH (DUF805 family)
VSQPEHQPHDPWSGRDASGRDQQPYGNPYAQQYGQPGQQYGQPAPGYAEPAYGYPEPAYGYGPPAAGPGGTPSLDRPYYGIGFTDAVRRVFAKYARFDGRASRSEYWWWTLATVVVFGVLGGLVGGLGGAEAESASPSPVVVVLALVLVLAVLAVLVPSIAVTVRRLHDADLSGWLYLLTLIPYVGGLILLVLTVLPPKPSGARFDRRPEQGWYAG